MLLSSLLIPLTLPALVLSHTHGHQPIHKRDGCVDIVLKGAPALANATDGTGFLGYVSPRASGARLTAVAITNQTTNETFLLIPSCSGRTFSVVTPDGLVFKLDKNLVVKNAPKQACSVPSAVLRKRYGQDFGLDVEKRQGLDLVGGGFVSFDATQCGNPATGLSPSRLEFTCDLPFFHYLGFSWDNMPLYRNDPLSESAPGRYSGWCPFPTVTDLSQQPLCTTGRDAIKPVCDILTPSPGGPVPIGSPAVPVLVAAQACAPLFFIPVDGPALLKACEIALGAAIGFCKVATNSKVQEALCGEPPGEIPIDIWVKDRGTNEEIRTHMSIVPTGVPRPLVLPTFNGSADCPSTTLTPSAPPTEPTGPATPSDPPNLCAPNTRNADFEGGFPENPANGFLGYNFKGSTWGIDCYQSRGFAPVDGRCYAYTYPNRAEPIGTPGASNTDNGIFHNLDLDASCVGQPYTLSVSVRRQPDVDADCGVQVLLGHDGFHGTDDLAVIFYEISTTAWQTLTYTFQAANPAGATNPEVNFFCTRIGAGGAPWFAFDSWYVS